MRNLMHAALVPDIGGLLFAETTGEMVTVHAGDLGRALVSFVILVVFGRIACGRSVIGSTRGTRLNWTTFMIGMFFAATVYSFGFAMQETGFAPNALFFALQMMIANRDVPTLVKDVALVGAGGDIAFFLFLVYTDALFLISPVTTVLAVVSYLTQFLSTPRMWWRSFTRETYVFSDLSKRNLTLAEDVRRCHEQGRAGHGRRASIVFAGVSLTADDALRDRAEDMGAICNERPASSVWNLLSGQNPVRIVFNTESQIDNITDAAALRDSIVERATRRNPQMEVFAIASLTSAEALIRVGERTRATSSGTSDGLRVYRIDWARSLVEHALDACPIFLHGIEPGQAPSAPIGLTGARERYLAWERELYDRPDRHVVVVGAGHLGIEFLRLALSYAQVGSYPTDEPLNFTFDVFDAVEDPLSGGTSLAGNRFFCEAPQAAEGVDCTFHLADPLGPEVALFIARHIETITYVFVALEDDILGAQVAMRIRSVLERELVRHIARDEGQKAPDWDARRAYVEAARPLVVAVVADDELAGALSMAEEDGFAYRIEAIGSDSQMYSYEQIFAKGGKGSEYERRSSRAAQGHRKYRLFAYARSSVGAASGIRDLAIDWRHDLDEEARADLDGETLAAIELYKDYLARTTPQGDGPESHEWLLRMEHERWNRYMYGEGFQVATTEEVSTFFATGQPGQRHRLNIARLHPCIVPFDELADIDGPIDDLYAECERHCDSCALAEGCRRGKTKSTSFTLQDEGYIDV